MRRFLSLLVLFTLAVTCANAQQWNLDRLPPYQPAQTVSGTIRIMGGFSMRIMKDWEGGFVTHHPGIVFTDKLSGTAVAIGGLCTGVADVGVLAREIWPIELIAFNRTFDYDPLEIMVATGTFDVEG